MNFLAKIPQLQIPPLQFFLHNDQTYCFPFIHFLLDLDSYLSTVFPLFKNLMTRIEKKMVEFTKSPFYMLTRESFCEWLSSLDSCTTDSPFSFLWPSFPTLSLPKAAG